MNKKELRIGLHEPLTKYDTEIQTYGCRANNPDICSHCDLPGVCAFTSEDSICKSPSKSWKKIYNNLKEEEKKNEK